MKKYIIYSQVYQYPYSGRTNDSKEYLSDKICSYRVRIRKKILQKAKWLIVSGDFVLRLTNGAVPSQAIGLPISTYTPNIIRSIHSNVGLSKKDIINQVIKDMPSEVDFTKKEIDQFYNLAIELRNHFLSQ